MSAGEAGEDGRTDQVYRFAEIVVDGPAHSLERAGERVPVEPKAFAVLLALLRHPGELLPRDRLLDEVWGHHHVTPGVLTRVIAQLRHALDDDPHHPRFIQTQHALGYRFIGELQAAPDSGRQGAADRRQPRLVEPTLLALTPANDGPSPALADAPADAPADEGLPEPTPTVVEPASPGDARSLRWRIAAVVAVVALILGAVWLGRSPPSASLPGQASIAVLPVTSLGPDDEDAYFADGLAIEMVDALAGVPGLKVAAHTGAVGDDVDIKAVGRALGVASVLDVSVRRAGKRVRINARLSDTRSGFTLWSEGYDRELSDVFAVQTEIANQVVHALLGALPKENSLGMRLSPTRSVAAFDAYLKGIHASRSQGDPDSTIGFFREALAADGGFARAQAGICRAEIQRLESNRDATGFDRAQAACRRAARMAPELREVSLAFGDLYRVQGRYDAAVEQYNKALEDQALRADAYIGLGRIAGARRQGALAREYFNRAIALRPGDGATHRELGYHHYVDGELAQAAAAYRTAASLQPDDSGVWSSLGGIYLASGDRKRAAEAFDRSLAIAPNYAALSNLGTLKYETGDYRQAASLYRRATSFMPDDFRTWGNLGDALAADPATAADSRAAFERAAELARRYVAVQGTDAQARAQLAWIEANLGDAARARELVAEAEAIGTEQAEVALWAAQTFALLGEDDQALARIAQSRTHGVAEQRLAGTPALKRLLAGGVAAKRVGDGQ